MKEKRTKIISVRELRQVISETEAMPYADRTAVIEELVKHFRGLQPKSVMSQKQALVADEDVLHYDVFMQ